MHITFGNEKDYISNSILILNLKCITIDVIKTKSKRMNKHDNPKTYRLLSLSNTSQIFSFLWILWVQSAENPHETTLVL